MSSQRFLRFAAGLAAAASFSLTPIQVLAGGCGCEAPSSTVYHVHSRCHHGHCRHCPPVGMVVQSAPVMAAPMMAAPMMAMPAYAAAPMMTMAAPTMALAPAAPQPTFQLSLAPQMPQAQQSPTCGMTQEQLVDAVARALANSGVPASSPLRTPRALRAPQPGADVDGSVEERLTALEARVTRLEGETTELIGSTKEILGLIRDLQDKAGK